jgi:LPS-assembly lipoprotein
MPRTWPRAILSLALCAILPACGFHPMYAHGSTTEGPAEIGLAEINVPVMPERTGQLLRQALQARFERGGSGLGRRYDLIANYSIGSNVVGIQQDTSATRIRYIGSSSWSLIAEDTQRTTLASGTARTVDGMNIFVDQYFTSDLESEAIARRMAEALADQIALQLGVYFNREAAKAATQADKTAATVP